MDDLNIAKNAAIHDANMQNRDMYSSLDEVRDHFVESLNNDKQLVINAIERAIVDRKHPCKVLHAMRIDWLRHVDCPISDDASTVTVGDFGPYLRRTYDNANLFMEQYYGVAHVLEDLGKELDERNHEFMADYY